MTISIVKSKMQSDLYLATTDYNPFVWLIFFIIPFNLKSRVAWSIDLIWFDTNINHILHTHTQLFLLQIHPYGIVWFT